MIKTTLAAAETMHTPAYIIVPNISRQQGKSVKDYQNPQERFLIWCSFKTYGGTEVTNNGVYMLLDTAEIVTWFDPRITGNCRLVLAEDESRQYEVLGAPENIDLANVYCKFKIQRIRGGA